MDDIDGDRTIDGEGREIEREDVQLGGAETGTDREGIWLGANGAGRDRETGAIDRDAAAYAPDATGNERDAGGAACGGGAATFVPRLNFGCAAEDHRGRSSDDGVATVGSGGGSDRGRSSDDGVATAGSGGGCDRALDAGEEGDAAFAGGCAGVLRGDDHRTTEEDRGGAGAPYGGGTGMRWGGKGGAHDAGRGARREASNVAGPTARAGGSVIGTSTSMEKESCRDIPASLTMPQVLADSSPEIRALTPFPAMPFPAQTRPCQHALP